MNEPGDDHLLDELEESPYLRRQKQVEVRRSKFNRRTAAKARVITLAGLLLAAVGYIGWLAVSFGLYDPRFAVSEERIELAAVATPELKYVSRRQVAEKFAGDMGRSIFRAPLEKRRVMLEELPWVERAMVARAWPDRLRVRVRERTPVAFLRTSTNPERYAPGSGLSLVDAHGVILDRPPRASFAFPVISGFGEQDDMEARRQRMRLYLALIEDLDRDGAHHSLDISEVDLSDPENARVTLAGRDGAGAVLVHLGNSNFLARYQTYLAHIREWRQQFEKIHSVDLRYERQIVVNPDRR